MLRKRKEIEAKGLPNFLNWRFITLTLDRERFNNDPLAGFLHARDRLRYFMVKARKAGLWSKDARWAWKLEFQQDGWPHWHLLVERTQKYSHDELAKIGECWGMGRTNCERIESNGEAFGYAFKYVFKPVEQQDDEDAPLFAHDEPPATVPHWFLHYFDDSGPGRPLSFSRVRFWQTSRGFYTRKSAPVEVSEPQSSIVPRPLSEVVAERDQRAQFVARTGSGKYRKSKVIALCIPFFALSNIAAWHIFGGNGAALGFRNYALPIHVLENATPPNQIWQLHQLIRENRLTLRQAIRLQTSGRSLERC